MGEYVLKVAVFHQPTNKPGDPFTYKTITQGNPVTIEDDERAQELIDAGALESPEETKARKAAERKSDKDDGPQGPGDSEPPRGRAGRGRPVAGGVAGHAERPGHGGRGRGDEHDVRQQHAS
jgi:hypothetical protein